MKIRQHIVKGLAGFSRQKAINNNTFSPSVKTNLVIVTDRGLLRVYQVIQGATDRKPHLELVEELKPESAHQKLTEQVSDGAGRFPKGRGVNHTAGELSVGERHNLELEQTRRLIRLLAGRINSLLGAGSVDCCWLAASAPIHLQLFDGLTAVARSKIRETLALDLTKDHPTELIGKFRGVKRGNSEPGNPKSRPTFA